MSRLPRGGIRAAPSPSLPLYPSLINECMHIVTAISRHLQGHTGEPLPKKSTVIDVTVVGLCYYCVGVLLCLLKLSFKKGRSYGHRKRERESRREQEENRVKEKGKGRRGGHTTSHCYILRHNPRHTHTRTHKRSHKSTSRSIKK